IIVTSTLINLARLSTPDALSAMLTLSALYLIAEREQMFWGSLILLVGLSVRPDTLVTAGCIWLALLLREQKRRLWYIGAGLLGLALVFLIKHSFHAYSWPI